LYFALYLLTLCPTVFWYDSAEYAAAAVTLGIPHPPGYPLYTLIGHLFTWLPTSEPAYALNLMSAVFGAATVGLCYLVCHRLGARPLAALCAAGTLGGGHVFWNQCVVTEVYTPALFVLLGVLLLVLRGLRRDSAPTLVAAAGLAGLGLGIHLFIATCGLGLGAMVLGLGLEGRIRTARDLRLAVHREGLSRRLRTAALCVAALLAGSCIYLYVPLRSSMNPALNFEHPTTWYRFSWFITGGNYKNWFMSGYPVGHQLALVGGIFYHQLLVVGVGLMMAGLMHLRGRPLLLIGLTLMVAGNIFFFFNYGVHDLEVFFLPAVTVVCVLVGLGVQAVCGWVDGHAQRRFPRMLARVALVLFPVSLTAINYSAVDLSEYTAARDYGERLCAQLPRKAVLLNFTTPPEWKDNAVFSNYFQLVLGRRRDVEVVVPHAPVEVLRLLMQSRAVYAYYPVPRLVATFVLRKEGLLHRVVKPRLDTGSMPPQ